MATLIVPATHISTGQDLSEFLYKEEIGVGSVDLEPYYVKTVDGQTEPNNRYALAKITTNNPLAFQGVYDWSTEGMPDDFQTLLEVMNRIRMVYFYREDHFVHRYFDVELPTGTLTIHLLTDDERNPFEKENVWFTGTGDLFHKFLNMCGYPQYMKPFTNLLYSKILRGSTSGGLINRPELEFYAQIGEPVNGLDHFAHKKALEAIELNRKPVDYADVNFNAEGDTEHWIKVGDKLSGASLVTRIRQGKVKEIPPTHYEVKSVKDAGTGQYSVWVRYTAEVQEVQEATDADSLALQAWERIEDKVKNLFMEEFKSLL